MRSAIIDMNPDRLVTLELCLHNPLPTTEGTDTFEDPLPAIIICPGGGYEFLSEREADPVASSFLRFGFQCFILRYSILEHAQYPHPAVDAARAVRWVRKHAGELRVDPGRIAVMGFSAGGHVTCLLGTKHADADLLAAEAEEYEALAARGLEANEGLMDFDSRPDAIVPCYAVTSLDWVTELKQVDMMGVDTIAAVGPHVPPTFIWTTNEDALVPATQSLRFVNQLAEHGVPFEYHHYQRGRHGLSTAEAHINVGAEVPENAFTWVELCARWLHETLG